MVSIVIVYYNTGNKNGFLDKIIWSLNRQTCQDFEILILNNNSPVDIDLTLYNEKIKIYNLGCNYGNCGARNIGTRLSKGDLITWNDGDTIYARNYIEKMIETNKEVMNCWTECGKGILNFPLDIVSNMLYKYEIQLPDNIINSVQYPEDLSSGLNSTTRGLCIKKEIAIKYPFDIEFNLQEGRLGRGWEDMELGLRLEKEGYKIDFIKDTFTLHIAHNPTTTENFYQQAYINWVKLLVKHRDILELKYKDWKETIEKIIKKGIQ